MDESKLSEKSKRGRAVMAEALGKDYLARRDAAENWFVEPLRRFSEENAFGDIWSRPGLPRKVRSMICLAMLTALNRPHEIRIHVNSALNNGCTPQEIQEALYQTVAYCGIPACLDSMKIAEEVLKERGLI